MAKASKSVIFAAIDGNNKISNGGIDNYKYVYEVPIASTAKYITFKNHARYGPYQCQQTTHTFKVTCKKGCGGNTGQTATRYAYRESLGISWTDSHPVCPIRAGTSLWPALRMAQAML